MGNDTAANNLRKIGESYYTISPSVVEQMVYFRDVLSSGAFYPYSSIHFSAGIRPAISLKNTIVISSGTCSEADPWVVQE